MAILRVCEDLEAQPLEIDLDVAITSLDARSASPTMPMAMAMTMPTTMPIPMPITMPMTSHASAGRLNNRGSNSAT
jgi:hypothetical protein